MEKDILQMRNDKNKKLNFMITIAAAILMIVVDVLMVKCDGLLMVIISALTMVGGSYYVTFKSKNEDAKIVIVPLLFIFTTFTLAYIQKGVPQAIGCMVVAFLMCTSYFRYDLLKILLIISNIIIITFSLGFYYILGFSFSKSITYEDDIMKIIGLILVECLLLGILKFTNNLIQTVEKQKKEVENNLIKKEELTQVATEKFIQTRKEIDEISVESKNISNSLNEFEKGIDCQVNSITEINTSVTNTIDLFTKIKEISSYMKDVAFIELLKITNDNSLELKKSHSSIEKVTSSLQNTDILVQSFDKNINKIIEVLSTIQSISDSVNLLSFNASIEAARAGEAGRGFSVVAHEIKKLSTETKETTIVVNNYIKEIQDDLNKILIEVSKNSTITEDAQKTICLVVEDFSKMKEVFDNVQTQLNDSDGDIQRTFNDMTNVQYSMESCIAITEEYVATIEDIVNRQTTQNELITDVTSNMNEIENHIKKM